MGRRTDGQTDRAPVHLPPVIVIRLGEVKSGLQPDASSQPLQAVEHTIGWRFCYSRRVMRDNLGSERMGSPVFIEKL